MFKPSQYFMECLNSGNARNVLGCIASIMYRNPGNENNEITDAFKYAKGKGINFIVDCKGEDRWEQKYNRAEWTDAYYAEVVTFLTSNFSEERLQHALLVGKEINKNNIGTKPPTNVNNNKPQKNKIGLLGWFLK